MLSLPWHSSLYWGSISLWYNDHLCLGYLHASHNESLNQGSMPPLPARKQHDNYYYIWKETPPKYWFQLWQTHCFSSGHGISLTLCSKYPGVRCVALSPWDIPQAQLQKQQVFATLWSTLSSSDSQLMDILMCTRSMYLLINIVLHFEV